MVIHFMHYNALIKYYKHGFKYLYKICTFNVFLGVERVCRVGFGSTMVIFFNSLGILSSDQ